MRLIAALARGPVGRPLAGRSDLGAGDAPPRETPGPEGWRIEGRVLDRIGPGGEDRTVACLSRCTLDGGRVEDAEVGALEACLARRATFRRAAVGRVALCDLTGAVLEGVVLHEVTASSLRKARCTDTTLERLVLVDLSGARLLRVRIRDALGVDLTGAVLEDCDLEGTDLAGHPEAGPRRGSVLQRVVLAVGVVLCLLALVAVLRPPPPPAPEAPPAVSRPATPGEAEAARHSLARLREALADTHETMVHNGASEVAWPSLEDLAANRYDVDGDGPDEVRRTLLPGGLPDNPLAPSRGRVVHGCEEALEEGALSGTDADWHYCDRTGRVLAGAGWSGQPTAAW